jgi:hypothetical protein
VSSARGRGPDAGLRGHCSAFWLPEQFRAWFEGDDPAAATEHLVAAWLDAAVGGSEDVAARFWDTLGTNLQESRSG